MPNAVRIGDVTDHGGTIVGPGEPTVLIGGMPAAVAPDNHDCPLYYSPGSPHGVTPFAEGSQTVLIGKKPALRIVDKCICGASPAVGEPTVQLG